MRPTYPLLVPGVLVLLLSCSQAKPPVNTGKYAQIDQAYQAAIFLLTFITVGI